MSFDALVNLVISLSAQPIPLASFGVPLILATLTGPQVTAMGSDLTLQLTPATWATALTAIGVTTSEDVYRAASAMFSQADQPERAYVGRRATPVAMVRRFTIGGTTNGNYTITINGTAHLHAAVGETATQIRDALIVLINAGAQAPRVTATTNSTDGINVTADVAGETFTDSTATTGAAITSATITANVGISTDLPLIRAERDDWYFVMETSRVAGNARMLAAAIEPLVKYAWVQTLDAVAQAAPTTDIGSELGALGYVRTGVIWHDDDDDFVDAAWIGLMAPQAPGSATWANKTLVGVTGIVPTSEADLASKRYNWLERFVAAGFSMTRHGKSIGAQFTDIIVGRDWLHNLIQTRVIEAMRDAPKLTYDDRGAAIISAAIRGALQEAADAEIVDRASIVVTVPAATSQSDANRGIRHFPNVTFSARLLGAIHSVAISGALAP